MKVLMYLFDVGKCMQCTEIFESIGLQLKYLPGTVLSCPLVFMSLPHIFLLTNLYDLSNVQIMVKV